MASCILGRSELFYDVLLSWTLWALLWRLAFLDAVSSSMASCILIFSQVSPQSNYLNLFSSHIYLMLELQKNLLLLSPSLIPHSVENALIRLLQSLLLPEILQSSPKPVPLSLPCCPWKMQAKGIWKQDSEHLGPRGMWMRIGEGFAVRNFIVCTVHLL